MNSTFNTFHIFRGIRFQVAILLTSLLGSYSSHAQGFDFGGGDDSSELKTKAELFSEVVEFVPGQPFDVALKLVHEDGWHSYYLNPGFVGLPPGFQWQLPEGWSHSEVKFQVPHREEFMGETTYGYVGTHYLFATLTPPSGLAAGTEVALKLGANWQVCDDKSCLQEPGPSPMDFLDFELKLRAASDGQIVPSAEFDELQTAARDLPQSLPQWQIRAVADTAGWQLQFTPRQENLREHPLSDVYFFSSAEGVVNNNARQSLQRSGEKWVLTVPKAAKASDEVAQLSGIVAAGSGWLADGSVAGLLLDNVAIESTAGNGDSAGNNGEEQASIGGLLLVIGGMFVGGLILNLMPCVFPVIGLKIMGFVNQAGDDRAKIAKHGLVFALGVLICFWVMAALLLPVRATTGWGDHLANPWVVFVAMAILFALSLSMFGVFELGTSAAGIGSKLQSKQGIAGSFFAGVLCVIIATPCSGPFLGAAIGAAWVLSSTGFVLSLTSMGLGLATPYLLLSIFPALVQKLPRPGPWMESFKQGMSFLLFASTGFLLWVYNAQVGGQMDEQKGLFVLLGLTFIAAALWVYGRWDLPSRPSKTRRLSRVFSLALLIGGIFLAMPGKTKEQLIAEAEATGATPPLNWEEWSPEYQASLLSQGKPVFIDFTAKWCATCQTNKRSAYSAKAREAFQERGVVMLKASLDSSNPPATKAVKSYGRAAIPVNVLITPDDPDNPTVTPELLTPGYLINLLEEKLPSEEAD